MGIVLEGRDPELARRVAIKILHPEHARGAEGRAAADRLTREARAMARLAHPNVVTVYEVGWSEGRIFVAMELIEGTTLRGWLAARPRSWREIVAIFVAAGRGLAAAHAAGLVHRDFKPDNVLIDRDGHPHVADFGLAAVATSAAAVGASSASELATQTTRAGIAGTPAYMAPEQWRGGAIDPRTDQFAFGVALWEALHGERPFAGADLAALERAICAGELVTPRRPAAIPRWLDALLRRTLALTPAARWPALTTALEVLERRLRRRRWGVAAGVAGAAAIGATVMIALAVTATPDVPRAVCASPTTALETSWPASARAALAARLVQRDPRDGAARAASIDRAIDRHGASWAALHVDACRAEAQGREATALRDRRMVCLDRAWHERVATIARLDDATTAAALDGAAAAATVLPSLDACATPAALPDVAAEPRSLAARFARSRFDRALARATVAHRAGEPSRAVAALIERARGLGDPARLAAALEFGASVAAPPAAARLTCEADLAELTRALTAAESVLGVDDPLIGDPLVRLARCHVAAGRWQPAIDAAARVLALPVRGLEDELRLHAQYLHGRARHGAGLDRAAALDEIRAAHAAMQRAGVADRLDSDAWLAAQP